MGGMTQPNQQNYGGQNSYSQQYTPEGTLVRGANGQEYLAVPQANGQSLLEPVIVQRQGQGQYYGR